jgi:hypothetical protein
MIKVDIKKSNMINIWQWREYYANSGDQISTERGQPLFTSQT